MVGARAGQTVARSTDSGAHRSAIRSASTVKPLSLPPPRHLHQMQADASITIGPLILIPAQRVRGFRYPVRSSASTTAARRVDGGGEAGGYLDPCGTLLRRANSRARS